MGMNFPPMASVPGIPGVPSVGVQPPQPMEQMGLLQQLLTNPQMLNFIGQIGSALAGGGYGNAAFNQSWQQGVENQNRAQLVNQRQQELDEDVRARKRQESFQAESTARMDRQEARSLMDAALEGDPTLSYEDFIGTNQQAATAIPKALYAGRQKKYLGEQRIRDLNELSGKLELDTKQLDQLITIYSANPNADLSKNPRFAQIDSQILDAARQAGAQANQVQGQELDYRKVLMTKALNDIYDSQYKVVPDGAILMKGDQKVIENDKDFRNMGGYASQLGIDPRAIESLRDQIRKGVIKPTDITGMQGLLRPIVLSGMSAKEIVPQPIRAKIGQLQGVKQVVDQIKAVADRVITDEGLTARLTGMKKQGAAKLGWDTDVTLLQSKRGELAPVARNLMQEVGTMTEGDIARVEKILALEPTYTKAEKDALFADAYAMIENQKQAQLMPYGLSPEELAGAETNSKVFSRAKLAAYAKENNATEAEAETYLRSQGFVVQ